MHYMGISSTAITDGSTTATLTIDGTSTTFAAADAGAVVIYGEKEYVWNGTKWQEFGSTGSLKALAFKDSASGSYTPAGGVSQPSFTGTSKSVSVTGTPAGSVTISTGSGTANYTPAGTVSKPTFTGSEFTSTGTFKPAGNVTIGTGNGTANYTPAGSISVTPTVTLNTTTVNSITAVGTLPTCTLPALSATVASETLTLSWSEGSFSPGTLPTKGSNTTVATTVKTATATGSFTGTGV